MGMEKPSSRIYLVTETSSLAEAICVFEMLHDLGWKSPKGASPAG